MFSGRFDHSIDEKGRVSIPARFREILQRENHDRLYITNFPYDGEHCLALYPPSQWDTLNANLRTKPRFDPRVQAFQTFFIGGAHEVPVDKQGRILIPTNLREFAHLDREVTFSAMQDHFQLWDRKILEKVLKAAEEKINGSGIFHEAGSVTDCEKMNLAVRYEDDAADRRHVPVMVEEVCGLLSAHGPLAFVDVTVGTGGHAEAMLRASKARMLGLDRDAAAIAVARDRLVEFGDRVVLERADFGEIAAVMKQHHFDGADAMLADLGMSSYALDDPKSRVFISARRSARYADGRSADAASQRHRQ